MSQDLLSKVHTVEDKVRFESDLDKLARAVFKQGAFQKILRSEVTKELSDIIITDVGDSVPTTTYLKGLNQQLESLQVVDITLAFVPTQAQVDQLYTWLGDSVGHKFIFNIHTNEALIAGARVEYAGRFTDASLAKQLN